MNAWITFWYLVTIACVAWYSTITIYVAIKGAFDIKDMLQHLSELKEQVGEE